MHFNRISRLLVVAVPLIAACEESDLPLGLGGGTRFTATLSGANVRPNPVATTASGTAELNVREPDIGSTRRRLAFTVTASSISSATAVHIHLGGASVGDGQLLATLFANPTDTAITAAQLVSGSIAEDALGAVTLDSLVTLMTNGAAYVDIHSGTNPSGLVRGQLVRTGQPVPSEVFAARALSGTKERPNPVTTTATGSATFEVQSGGSVRYNVAVSGITGVIMAHIHTGVADSAGPIAVTLFTSTTPTGPLTGTLATGSFTSTNVQLSGVSLDSLLSLMRRGRTYVNVHTQVNQSGEIRAQIEPASVLP